MTPGDDWNSSFFRMGSGESKKTDNVVADTVDFSTNMSKDFAVLRLTWWDLRPGCKCGYLSNPGLHGVPDVQVEESADGPGQAEGPPG